MSEDSEYGSEDKIYGRIYEPIGFRYFNHVTSYHVTYLPYQKSRDIFSTTDSSLYPSRDPHVCVTWFHAWLILPDFDPKNDR